MICSTTGIDTDYILYGNMRNKKLNVKENLYTIINASSKTELEMYYRCICTIKSYVNKNIQE